MTSERDRLLATIRKRAMVGRGRGINAHKFAARKWAVLKRIVDLLDRGPKRGEISKLQRDMRARYGITSAEFYKLRREAERSLPALNALRAIAPQCVAEIDLVEQQLTAEESHRWRERSFASVLRLARWRARRKNSSTFLE